MRPGKWWWALCALFVAEIAAAFLLPNGKLHLLLTAALLGITLAALWWDNRRQQLRTTHEAPARQGNHLRMILLLLCLGMALAALFLQNSGAVLALTGAFAAAALILLYRNMESLTGIPTDSPKHRTLLWVTLMDLLVLAFGMGAAYLSSNGYLGKTGQEIVAAAVILAVMLVGGNIAPKIPFNRYTGLRLPWTVRDADTWRLAHRVLGYVSFPLAFAYVALLLGGVGMETATLSVVILWVGIPGLLSYWMFRRKYP